MSNPEHRKCPECAVMVVDAYPIWRAGIHAILGGTEFRVAGEASSRKAALMLGGVIPRTSPWQYGWTRPNSRPIDYYVLPSADIAREKLRLAETNGLFFDSYRFDDLDYLIDMSRRVHIREVA